MIEPTEISVSVGRTVNLGNYESERIDIGIKADLTEGEEIWWAEEKIRSLLTLMLIKIEANIKAGHPEIKRDGLDEYQKEIYKTTHIKPTGRGQKEETPREIVMDGVTLKVKPPVDKKDTDSPIEKPFLDNSSGSTPTKLKVDKATPKAEATEPTAKPVPMAQQLQAWWTGIMEGTGNRPKVGFFAKAYRAAGYKFMVEIPDVDIAKMLWKEAVRNYEINFNTPK